MKKLSYLVLLACLLSLMFPNVFARADHGTQINYYSSPAQTTLVGQRCYNMYADKWYKWGIQTVYRMTDENEDCGLTYY